MASIKCLLYCNSNPEDNLQSSAMEAKQLSNSEIGDYKPSRLSSRMVEDQQQQTRQLPHSSKSEEGFQEPGRQLQLSSLGDQQQSSHIFISDSPIHSVGCIYVVLCTLNCTGSQGQNRQL